MCFITCSRRISAFWSMSNMEGKLLFLTFQQEGLLGLLLVCVLGGDILQAGLSLCLWGCVPYSKRKKCATHC